MAYSQHRSESAATIARCAVITLSDTRTAATDASGQMLIDLLTADGHIPSHYQIIPDEPTVLSALLDELIARTDIDVILCNGGTGISRRDHTIDVVETKLTRTLPGFGELFRMLSHEQIGSGAMLSRATGGVAEQTLLFALPGSTKAVELATRQLILPELRHLIFEVRK